MQLDKVQNLGNFVGVVNVPRFAFPPATLCQVLISAYICPSVWGWGEDPLCYGLCYKPEPLDVLEITECFVVAPRLC
jgi:hypothetical protein